MTDTSISAAKLAGALAEGFAAVVPPEVEVSVEGPVVRLRMRGTRWGMDADLRPFPDLRGLMEIGESTGVAREELIALDSARGRALRVAMERRPPSIDVDRLPEDLENIIDQMQDQVAETIAEPWPALTPGPMPEPFVEIRNGLLVAGFGDPADPALVVLSVALDDVR